MKCNAMTVLLAFSFIGMQAQNKKMKITWSGDSIGYIKANRVYSGEHEKIAIDAISRVSVLWLVRKIVSKSRTSFKAGKMQHCHASLSINGKVKSSTVRRLKSYYKMLSGTKVKYHYSSIGFTVSKLFYHEPKGLDSIFSEQHQQFCQLKKTGTATYQLSLPNGYTNSYTYKNGKMVSMSSLRYGRTLRFEQID